MKSEEELLELARKYGWKIISFNEKLSEDFIEKYQDKVDWESIPFFQELSEEFIKKFQDNVDWYYISECQKLSEDFVLNNFSKINIRALKENKYFDFNNIRNTELKLLLELRGEI
jgi:hypothetical protein